MYIMMLDNIIFLQRDDKKILIYFQKIHILFLKEINCQDIDNLNDWKIAELKFKLRYKIG